jgi:hypothetical protein
MSKHMQAVKTAEPPARDDRLNKPAAPWRMLLVSPPGDALEREADEAAQVALQGRHVTLHAAIPTVAIARTQAIDPRNRLVQRAIAGAGQPLNEAARKVMQSRFGCDFSQVRVHDDADADAATTSLSARAFAAGPHIVFRRNAYQPNTREGLRLLAHELAHVAQQRRAGLARDLLFVQRADRISATAQTRTLPAPPVRSFGPEESPLGEINQIRKTSDLAGLMAMTPALAAPQPSDNAQTTTALKRGQNTQREHTQALDGEQREGVAQVSEAGATLEQASDMAEGAAAEQGKDVEQKPVTLAAVIEKGVNFAEPEVQGEFEGEDERAEAMLEARVNKTRAETAMGEFALKGVDVSAALKDAGLGIEPQMQAAADEAKLRISTAATTNRDAIAKTAKEARGKVSGREAGAKSKLEREYKAADKSIEDAYKSEKLAIELHYGLKLVSFTTTEITGGASISRIFKAGSEKFGAAGDAVSAKATEIGAEKATGYAAEYAPDGDFFDGEDYYRRKRSARVDASKETAKKYAEAFAQQGKDAAGEVAKGDQDVIVELGKQVSQKRDEAQVEYKKALADLETSTKAAKASAKSSYDAQQASLKASGIGSRAAISRLEKALLKQLDETELQQLAQTDGNAGFALTQLILAVDGAATSLEQTLAAGLLDLEQQQAPDAEALAAMIADAQTGLDEAQAVMLAEFDGSVAAAMGQLLANADATVAQFAALLQQADDKSKPIVESFDASTTQAMRATVEGLKKTAGDFVKGAADTRTAGKQGIDDAYQSVVDYITQIETKLPKALADKAKEFQGTESSSDGLMAALFGKLPETTDIREDIKKQAEEAADAIKPAWKEVIAFVLTILITVIVAVAIAALVASGVGFGLGLLLAAGIGALGGVAKAGVEAWRADKPLTWKDVGKAAVLGAIDGMLQFAGGRALKALKLPDTGWKKAATEGGSNFVQGVGNDFAGLGYDALVPDANGKTKSIGWGDVAGVFTTNIASAGVNTVSGGIFGKTKLKANQFEDALYKGGLKDLGKKEIIEGLKAKGKDVLINVTTNTLGDKDLMKKAYAGNLTLDDVKETALKNVGQEGVTAGVHYGMKKERFADKDAPEGSQTPKKSVEDKLKDKFNSAGKTWDDYKAGKKAGGKKSEGGDKQGGDGQQQNQQQQQQQQTTQQQQTQQEGATLGAGGQQQNQQQQTTQQGDANQTSAKPIQQNGEQQTTARSQTEQGETKPTQQPSTENNQTTQQQDAQPNDAAKNSTAAKPAQDNTTPEPTTQSKPVGSEDPDAIKPPAPKPNETAPTSKIKLPEGDLEAEPTRLQAKPAADEDAAAVKPKKQGKAAKKEGAKKAGSKAEAGGEQGEGQQPKAKGATAEEPATQKKEKAKPGKANAEAEAAALAKKQVAETALDDLTQKIKAGDPAAVHGAAEALIKGAGNWKADLKQQLARMSKEERAQVETALVEARDKIVNDAFVQVKAQYPDVEMFNVGTKSFGSDIDITIKPKRAAGASPDPRSSGLGTRTEDRGGPEADPTARKKAIDDASKAALAMSKVLRAATGGETDATIDTNVYAYIGEDDVHLKSDADRQQQADTSRVLGLAEQKRGMTPKQWGSFKDELRFPTAGKTAKGKMPEQLGVERAANAQMKKDLRKAEAMVGRLDKVRATAEEKARAKAPDATEAEIARMAREDVVKKKRAELAREMGRESPDLKKVLRLQSDILWFEPDAYASRAAIDQAVGGQSMRAAGTKTPRNQQIDANLESITQQLKTERKNEQPDTAKIATLEDQARKLQDQRHEDVAADLKALADARTARGSGASQLTADNKLSNAAGVASANLGMMKDHIRHAADLDGRVKAAAKYGARIMQAEGDANLRTDPGVAGAFGAFMQSRAPGLPKEDADAVAKQMLDDFAVKNGYVDADGRPKVTEQTKKLFVKEVQQWAADATTKLHQLDATKRALNEPPAPQKPKKSDPSKPSPEDDPDATVAKGSSKAKDEPAEAPSLKAASAKAGKSAIATPEQTPTTQPQPKPAVPAADMENQNFVPIKPGMAQPTGLSGRLEGFKRTDIKTEAEANAHYLKWADQDPTREVALVYNHDTKTYEVVQGQSNVVKGEFLKGNKTVLKHFHHGADFACRLPSVADYTAFTSKSGVDKPWVSRVTYVNEMGEFADTVFGYHPGDAKTQPTFWVKYADKDGATQIKTFNDAPWDEKSTYKSWKQQHLTIVPIRPATPSADARQMAAPPNLNDPAAQVKPAAGVSEPAPATSKFKGVVPPAYDDDASMQNEPTRATKAAADEAPEQPSAKQTAKAKPEADEVVDAQPAPQPKPAPRKETVEEFLARGGIVERIPEGVSGKPNAKPKSHTEITAQPKEKPDDLSIYGEGPQTDAIHAADRRRAGMGNKPKHHVYPQEMRKWFEDHGFTGKRDIDSYTVVLDEDLHQAIHGGGDYRRGRREWEDEWNRRVRRELLDAEAAKRARNGRRLSQREIRAIIYDLMEEYGIPRRFVKY